MNTTYKQLVDLIEEKAAEQAERIYRLYGRQASRIYPSYHHVVMDIALTLEAQLDIPEEVIESTIESEGLAAKLGAIALFSHVKDEDDK